MANPSINRINITITTLDNTAINTGLTGALTGLASYTQALTQEERDSLFSLGDANLVFVQEVQTQAALLNIGFPAPLQLMNTNMITDLTLFNQLNVLAQGNVAQIVQRINDTRRLAAHEAYSGALAIYRFIEAGAAIGLQGYAAAYEILKARFAQQGGAPNTPQQPNP